MVVKNRLKVMVICLHFIEIRDLGLYKMAKFYPVSCLLTFTFLIKKKKVYKRKQPQKNKAGLSVKF